MSATSNRSSTNKEEQRSIKMPGSPPTEEMIRYCEEIGIPKPYAVEYGYLAPGHRVKAVYADVALGSACGVSSGGYVLLLLPQRRHSTLASMYNDVEKVWFVGVAEGADMSRCNQPNSFLIGQVECGVCAPVIPSNMAQFSAHLGNFEMNPFTAMRLKDSTGRSEEEEKPIIQREQSSTRFHVPGGQLNFAKADISGVPSFTAPPTKNGEESAPIDPIDQTTDSGAKTSPLGKALVTMVSVDPKIEQQSTKLAIAAVALPFGFIGMVLCAKNRPSGKITLQISQQLMGLITDPASVDIKLLKERSDLLIEQLMVESAK